MACPFFMPDQPFQSNWPFPHRLPLGAGWGGTCTAPRHEGSRPTEEELKRGCNLGYAKSCSRLPADRYADAVRFSIGEERDGLLYVRYACERNHAPVAHGELIYDIGAVIWIETHPDARLQRMAECYLQSQRARREAVTDDKQAAELP